MSDSNVGMGMVPHKKSCRCNECEIERLQAQVKDRERNYNEVWDQFCERGDEIERLQSEARTLRNTGISQQEEIERLREELNVTRLQRDAKLSSQTAVDKAAAREIERLQTKVDGQEAYVCDLEARCDRAAGIINSLRAALERLGSSEAMTLAFAINKNTNEGRELDARITFAREALQEGE